MGTEERKEILMKINFQTEKQKNANSNDGFKVIYAPAKRLAFKMRWYLLLTLILSPLAIFSWYMIDDKLLVTADGILTTEPITLKATHDVYVKNIDVNVGDRVESNQTLVELSSPVVEKELNLLLAKHKSFKEEQEKGIINLESLHKQQIATYKSGQFKQNQMAKRYEKYSDQGVLPLHQQLMLEQNQLVAQSQYQDALIAHEAAVNNHKNGAMAKTMMDIELAISKARAIENMLTVDAPKDAVVNDILVNEGEYVSAGEPLISVSNLDQAVVNVYLSPERMDYAKLGQTATITLPNGDTHQGVINKPTQLSQKLPDILSGPFDGNKPAIKVTLDITPAPEVTLEGLPVEVRFHYNNEIIQENNILSFIKSYL